MPSWGYNAHYLSPGADPLLPDEAPFLPITASSVAATTSKLWLVESTWYTGPRHGDPPTEPEAGFYRVYPPHQWAGAPPADGYSYGHCWPRHNGQFASTLFLDGHVRAMTMTTLSNEALW